MRNEGKQQELDCFYETLSQLKISCGLRREQTTLINRMECTLVLVIGTNIDYWHGREEDRYYRHGLTKSSKQA